MDASIHQYVSVCVFVSVCMYVHIVQDTYMYIYALECRQEFMHAYSDSNMYAYIDAGMMLTTMQPRTKHEINVDQKHQAWNHFTKHKSMK